MTGIAVLKRGLARLGTHCLCALILCLAGCAGVKPFEREMLADPIMSPNAGFAKQSLEQKFFSTREGSAGGNTGVGGGCGCSK